MDFKLHLPAVINIERERVREREREREKLTKLTRPNSGKKIHKNITDI